MEQEASESGYNEQSRPFGKVPTAVARFQIGVHSLLWLRLDNLHPFRTEINDIGSKTIKYEIKWMKMD